jgi:hypothetical protein
MSPHDVGQRRKLRNVACPVSEGLIDHAGGVIAVRAGGEPRKTLHVEPHPRRGGHGAVGGPVGDDAAGRVREVKVATSSGLHATDGGQVRQRPRPGVRVVGIHDSQSMRAAGHETDPSRVRPGESVVEVAPPRGRQLVRTPFHKGMLFWAQWDGSVPEPRESHCQIEQRAATMTRGSWRHRFGHSVSCGP